MTTLAENKLNALFEELVPASGKAKTVAGEIVRAISRIAYRNYNDGDHIGVGYGKETCNPPARYLDEHCDRAVSEAIYSAWGIECDSDYDIALEKLENAVLNYIEERPELKEIENEEDMWDYRTDEDQDDEWDEEDY